MHQEYPKWMYHRTEKPVIVHDAGAHEDLGEAWAPTPAAFEEELAVQEDEAEFESDQAAITEKRARKRR